MYGDFSAFVGAWALLLSCVALVIEPIAHGSRWFSRALRLATGIAGLITFFAARHIWQLIQITSPEDGPPVGWDPFRSLAGAFSIFWMMSAVVTIAAMAPGAFYRRITPLAARTPLVTVFLIGAGCSWASLDGVYRMPGPVAYVLAALMLGAMAFWARYWAQRRADVAALRFKQVGRALCELRAWRWLLSKLVHPLDLPPVALVERVSDKADS